MRWILPILALLAGCTPDFSSVAPNPSDVLPAMPDDHDSRIKCAECAVENCREELDACAGPCEKLRECKTQADCNDPNCHLECDVLHGESESYNRYRDCVFKYQCKSECKSGQNWGCKGNYNWNELNNNAVDLTIKVHQIADLLGGKLNEIIAPGESNVSIDREGYTDIWTNGKGEYTFGGVIKKNGWQMTLCRPGHNINGKYCSYNGLDAGTTSPVDLGPLTYDIRRGINITNTKSAKQTITVYIPRKSDELCTEEYENSGAITVMVYDCLGMPGSNISFSSSNDSEPPKAEPSSYWPPGETYDDDDDPPRIAGFCDLQDGFYNITVRRDDKEDVIASTSEPVELDQENRSVFVVLYPSQTN